MTREATEDEMSLLNMSFTWKRTFFAYDDVTIVIVSHSFWLSRFWVCVFSVAFESSESDLLQKNVFLSDDFKTIKSFCSMILKRSSLF
jgi:hypothetical protein